MLADFSTPALIFDAYLVAFLNSSLFKYCYRDNFPELLGGTRELSKIFFDKIPVLKVDSETEEWFYKKVQRIQALIKNGEDSHSLEVEIDNRIFDIYGLSESECKQIGFIEIT